MAKATPRQLAIAALSRVLNDPVPKVLYGSAKKPGVFTGTSQANKQAAQLCLDQGWLETTGEFEGQGRTRKELYRLSRPGIKMALENAEPVVLLSDSLAVLQRNEEQLANLVARVQEVIASSRSQKEMVGRLLERLKPPDLEKVLQNVRPAAGKAAPHPGPHPGEATAQSAAGHAWLKEVLEVLTDYHRRQPYGNCPLPELYRQVAAAHGLSIGQFHDGLRQLVEQKRIRLHPFTGAAYQLQDEQYALVAGQEIKYYAERLTDA